MAKMDIQKIREKLDAVKNRGSKTWKPKLDHDTLARVVPMEDGDSFKSFHFHYNVGAQGLLCPKRNFDEPCAICTFASKLYNDGDPESQAMAKKLFARQRFYSPIILREDKEPIVRVWGYSQTVYETLLKKCLNPKYGDITDPEMGADFTITYEKPAGKLYPNTNLDFDPPGTPLVAGKDSAKKTKELLESIPDFDSLFERKTPAEVADALEAFMAGGGSSDDGEGTEKYAGANGDSSSSSVDSAVDDLT